METIQFIGITPELLKQMIVEGISDFVKPKDEEVLLNQKQVAEFYGVSVHTIIRWQKQGKIKTYAIGGETRYKKSELLDNLKLIK